MKYLTGSGLSVLQHPAVVADLLQLPHQRSCQTLVSALGVWDGHQPVQLGSRVVRWWLAAKGEERLVALTRLNRHLLSIEGVCDGCTALAEIVKD